MSSKSLTQMNATGFFKLWKHESGNFQTVPWSRRGRERIIFTSMKYENNQMCLVYVLSPDPAETQTYFLFQTEQQTHHKPTTEPQVLSLTACLLWLVFLNSQLRAEVKSLSVFRNLQPNWLRTCRKDPGKTSRRMMRNRDQTAAGKELTTTWS